MDRRLEWDMPSDNRSLKEKFLDNITGAVLFEFKCRENNGFMMSALVQKDVYDLMRVQGVLTKEEIMSSIEETIDDLIEDWDRGEGPWKWKDGYQDV